MIFRCQEEFFEIPKFDQVINCQKAAQIGSISSYQVVLFTSIKLHTSTQHIDVPFLLCSYE